MPFRMKPRPIETNQGYGLLNVPLGEIQHAAEPVRYGLLGLPDINREQMGQPSQWRRAVAMLGANKQGMGAPGNRGQGTEVGNPASNAVQDFLTGEDRYRRIGEGLELRKRQSTSFGGVMGAGPPSGQRVAGAAFGKSVTDALLSGVEPSVIADIIRSVGLSRPRVAQADTARNNEAAGPVPRAAIRRVQAGNTPPAGAAVVPLGTTPLAPLAQVQQFVAAAPPASPAVPGAKPPIPAPVYNPLTTWPVPGRYTLNAGNRQTREGQGAFGTPRDGGATHGGIDISAPRATPIVATGPGKIVHVQRGQDFGLQVVIDHGDGLYTQSAHLSYIAVKPGEQVDAGQVIGWSGDTGNPPPYATKHLHFEVREGGPEPRSAGGTVRDPLRYLPNPNPGP